MWVVEAKKRLNFEALGQVLVYGELYERYRLHRDSKPLKLAIVCLESDLEVERACSKYGVKVFVYEEGEKRVEEGGVACGVYGSEMIEKDKGEYVCELCEHFFGISSMTVKCGVPFHPGCGSLYGSYPAVESKVLRAVAEHMPATYMNKIRELYDLCPKCRERRVEELPPYISEGINVSTIAALLGSILENRWVTMLELEIMGLPREFIEYCIGRYRPGLAKARCNQRGLK